MVCISSFVRFFFLGVYIFVLVSQVIYMRTRIQVGMVLQN